MILLLLGAALGGIAWRLTVKARSDRVSARWLAEWDQREAEQSAQIESVNWQWPIRKLANEHALFNTQRLRKRA